MPYSKISDLPRSVKDNLPTHAERIYKSAFNSALEQYNDQENSEERAHRVAWSAVKTKYKKGKDGNWHPK